MVRDFLTAVQHAGLNYLLATGLLFFQAAFSLARLKKLGVLDIVGRNTSISAQAENITHSLSKLLISIVMMAGLSRMIVSPGYPGGVFSPDWPMVESGAILLLFSVPSVAVVVLLSKTISSRARPPSLAQFTAAAALSVAASGFGQILAAAAANDLLLARYFRIQALPVGPVIVIGSILTAGVMGHFYLLRRIMTQKGVPLRDILMDAAIAAIPTALAVAFASVQLEASL